MNKKPLAVSATQELTKRILKKACKREPFF
jgi:hypothetical protein